MKKLFVVVILSLVMSIGCKKHSQPIKWEKPGDELVGEWVWSKATRIYSPEYKWETTDLGEFTGNPKLKIASIVVFKDNGIYQTITEFPRNTDTLKVKWNVNGDTLRVIFDKDGRTSAVLYKVKDEKLIIDHLEKPKTFEEYTRD